MRVPAAIVASLLWWPALLARGMVCDPMDFGAVGDGQHNDSLAIHDAILACGNTSSVPVLSFPAGHVFRIDPWAIDATDPIFASWGHPGASVHIGANVTLVNAIGSPDAWPMGRTAMIHLRGVVNFTVKGSNDGAFEVYGGRPFGNHSVVAGNGSAFWAARREDPSVYAPVLVMVQNSRNVSISGLTLQDSPMFHLVTTGCTGVRIVNMTVTAPGPEVAVNTDAVDLNGEDQVIEWSYLSTGDDNVAIKPNSNNIILRNLVCGTGEGTSIGSVGEGHGTGTVSDVLVSNIRYNGTRNGANIKTWQNSTGYVRNVTFENLEFVNVSRPVVIDQFYCPKSQHSGPCPTNSSRAVRVSNVTFRNLRGSQSGGWVGQVHCSHAALCENLTLVNVSVVPFVNNITNKWSCLDVNNSVQSNVEPPVQISWTDECYWNTEV